MTYFGRDIFATDPDLEVVRHVSLDDEPYQFDERIIARDQRTGEYFTARDSGCSCPIPFEDFTSRDDLVGVRYSSFSRSLTQTVRDNSQPNGYRFDTKQPKSRMHPQKVYEYGGQRLTYEVYRCSWDDLILEAKDVLKATQGTSTDRFYGTPPDASTIADYIKWLHECRVEAYKAAGRRLPRRLRSRTKSVLL